GQPWRDGALIRSRALLDPKVFKAYDVRGIYPTELDEDGARAIGRAYVEHFEPRRIAVGRDMRLSSPAMARAAIEGAAAAGARSGQPWRDGALIRSRALLDPKVFKAYDVRGIYPTELDEDGARAIGRAYVEHFEPRRIAVGRDMRLSSPAMARAAIEGAAAAGA